jgi:hypothetical protein
MKMLIQMKRETIHLKTGYTRMATVLVFHEYYKNLICRDLDIRPDGHTVGLMREYGILMKNHPNGFSLACDRSRDYEHQVFDGELLLAFDVRIVNPLFVNFTDIPYTSDLHFEFRQTEDPSHPYLHANRFVTSENYSSEGADGLSGRILLSLNNGNDWFGVGSIEKKLKEESNYFITFRSRRTFWHYIFSTSNEKGRQFSIISPDRSSDNPHSLGTFISDFDGPKNGETRSGRPVLIFSSATPLPFRDRWEDFAEVEVVGNDGHTFRKPLSYARPGNMYFDDTHKRFTTSIFESL